MEQGLNESSESFYKTKTACSCLTLVWNTEVFKTIRTATIDLIGANGSIGIRLTNGEYIISINDYGISIKEYSISINEYGIYGNSIRYFH